MQSEVTEHFHRVSRPTAEHERLWAERRALEIEKAELKRLKPHGGLIPGVNHIFFVETAIRMAGLMARGQDNARTFRMREVDMVLPTLPKAFDGLRVLQIADLHFGAFEGFEDALIDFLQGVETDLCVLTGDYRLLHMEPNECVYAGMTRVLETVRASEGFAGILGNHDSILFRKAFSEMGITMLVNQHTYLERDGERLWIAGVDDPHYYGMNRLKLALDGMGEEGFRLLLAHSPELVEEAAAQGIDLYLCGHTHGGQVCLPGEIMVMKNARARRRYCKGQWQCGTLQGYTTNGLGVTDVNVRFNCPAEAAHFTLRCGKQ